MALFDFLKKKRTQEKQKTESPVVFHHEPKKEIQRGAIADRFALVRPHITERARDLSSQGQYTFVVSNEATKKQIQESVQKLYNVHVREVRIVNVPGKPRRRGLTQGIKKGYKKAVVALKHGEAIDIF